MQASQALPPCREMRRKGGGTKHFSSCISLIRKENLSQKPQEVFSGPGQNWSTGQFCLEEDWMSLKRPQHPLLAKGYHQRLPIHPGVLEIQRAILVVTQTEPLLWHLVGWSRDVKCPKMHRTLFHTHKDSSYPKYQYHSR